MKEDKWVWMPHPGHLIISYACRFHLNTYVGNYIVSTVGEWWPDYRSRLVHAEIYDPKWLAENVHRKGDDFDHAYFERFGFEEISCGRKYETMFFKAQKSKTKCCPYEMTNTKNLDFDAYNNAGKAAEGHHKMCLKYSKL